MRFRLRPNIYARPRRPTVDGAPPLVHLHDFYAGECRAGPPLTGRRTAYISIAFTFAAPRTMRATPHPSPAAHAAKIGLTGVPASLTRPDTPHPPAPQTLLFSLLALAGFPALPTLRATPHPAPPPTLPKLA